MEKRLRVAQFPGSSPCNLLLVPFSCDVERNLNRTSNGDLVFFVNGVSQSIAASGLPERVFAVVDLYGKCATVALMDNTSQVA